MRDWGEIDTIEHQANLSSFSTEMTPHSITGKHANNSITGNTIITILNHYNGVGHFAKSNYSILIRPAHIPSSLPRR